MALTIDELEIKIETEASQAEGGISALAKSLQELKSVLGGASGLSAGLTDIANSLKSFSDISKFNLTSKINQLRKLEDLIPTLGGAGATQLAGNLREIAGGLSVFSSVPNVNVSSLARGIKSLDEATKAMDNARLTEFFHQMKDIASGLSQLNGVKASGVVSVVNSLKKIPDLTKSLDDTAIEEFAKAIGKLVEVLAPLATQMDAVGRGFSVMPSHMKRAIKASHMVVDSNGKVKKSYNSMSTSLSRSAAKFWTLYYTMSRVVDVFADAFNESNDYIESLNLFTVSMGDATEASLEYAKSLKDAMGIDVAEWITNQGAFMRMATGFGIASDKAEVMSQNLTQLAYDMSSFFNTDVQTAMDKLQSGMSGQIKGLKEWGYNLSVAALQETALRLGIEQSVRTMTEAQKAQLRYITLIERSNGVMGDMARTIITPANSMRILSAQITQLKRSFGEIVSVLTTQVIPYVQAFVEIVADAASELADFFGFEMPKIDYSNLDLAADIMDGVDDSIVDAENSVKGLKKQLMGFDELNILKSDDGEDDKKETSYDLGIELPEYDFMEGLSKEYRTKIDEIKKEFTELSEDLAPIATLLAGMFAFSWVKDAVEKFKELKIVKEISNGITEAMGAFNFEFENGQGNLKGLSSGLKAFRKSLSPVTKILGGALSVFLEFRAVKDVWTDVANGTKSVSDGLLGLVPAVAAASAALYLLFGPAGLLVAGATALLAVSQAQTEFHLELAKTEYYQNNGIAISELRDSLNGYFDAMDFDKQAEWVDTINGAEKAYKTARESYDEMWASIAEKPVFDTSDIENLTNAINGLAEASKELNDARLGSAMESIKQAIELNITDQLTGRLDELLGKLEEAKIALGIEIDGAQADYHKLMAEIQSNGGVATDAQKAELQSIAEEIKKFTITNDKNATDWLAAMSIAKQNAIYAGADKDEVIKNVETLAGDRDDYLRVLEEKYQTDKDTLMQLIELDKTEFGGTLGFGSADLLALKRAHAAMVEEVRGQYDAVLDSIIKTYESNMLDISFYDLGDGFFANIGDAIGVGTSYLDLANGSEFRANRKLAKEQQELLELLKKIRGYASGGFPSAGDMFIANEKGPELVGRIGNRSAVVNNDQIITGIASAVYNAMMAANEDGNHGGGNARIVVQIGDQAVGEASVRYINGQIVQTGVSPIYN